MGYSYKNKLTATLYYQQVKDSYSQLVTFNNGTKIIDYANMFDQTNYGINLGYNDILFKLWEVSASANLYYSKSTGIIPEVIGQKSFNMYYNINNTFTLNTQKTVALFANFAHMLPGSSGNFKSDGYSILSLGAKLYLMDKKLQINISVDDVFKKHSVKVNLFIQILL